MTSSDPIAFADHDHHTCIASALDSAERTCQAAGVRLTPVRRRALEVLLESHRALGAYDVLDRLAEDGLGKQPPAAYRALDFLVDHGLAHKIEGLNAYTACTHPGAEHAPIFMICVGCKTVAESCLYSPSELIGQAADRIGFRTTRVVIEAEGLCPDCQASQDGTAPDKDSA